MTAYNFKGQKYCDDCVADAMFESGVITVVGLMLPLNVMLERVAIDLGINREDERSFDQSEFPKEIESLSLVCLLCEELLPHSECVPEECDNCGDELK